MKNELYRAIIKQAKDAEDGETATVISVTEENNGYAVWLTGFDILGLLAFNLFNRNLAIEKAVSLKDKTEEQLRPMVFNV